MLLLVTTQNLESTYLNLSIYLSTYIFVKKNGHSLPNLSLECQFKMRWALATEVLKTPNCIFQIVLTN